MQSRHPVLGIPAAIASAPPGRSRAVAAALGLVLALAAPVAGSPPPSAAAPEASSPLRGPAIDSPIRPPRQEAPPPFAAPPGTTSLISVNTDGGFGSGPSAGSPNQMTGGASISSSGRYVAFPSAADDLVADDANRSIDIFVRDRRGRGGTIRLPVPGGAPPIGGRAFHPSISADGSAVAFAYIAPQINGTFVPVCAGRAVIFLWRRATGISEVVSFFPAGQLACTSTEPSVSADGRYVAFTYTGLGDTDEANRFIFVRDTVANSTVLASADVTGGTADGDSFDPAISRDGRIVAFTSDAGDLVASDQNKQRDVFAHDLTTGQTELVSIGAGGQANGRSEDAAISADGNRIAFESRASNLVAGLSPTAQNVYVRVRASGQTLIGSAGLGGADAAGDSGQTAISSDGQVVAFASEALNLIASAGDAVLASLPEGRGGGLEVYAHDLLTNQTIRISDTATGAPGGSESVRPAIAGNGRFVAFESISPAIIAGDPNQVRDVFLRDLPPGASAGPATLDFGTRAIGVPGPPLAAILTNTGWGTMTVGAADKTGAAPSDFDVALNSCVGRTLRWLESCPVTVVFTPTDRGSRDAVLTVDHDGPGSPATVRLIGGGSRAELKIEPPIGRPGIVVIATGSGFPPDTVVSLVWSRGVSPKLPTITTDAVGAFRVQVLVFHNDIVGDRDLIASPVGGTGFPSFEAPFLVVEAGSQPPRFIVRSPYDDRPPTLVMRR